MAGVCELGSVKKTVETDWFTLIVENPDTYYVLVFTDSPLLTLKTKTKIVHPREFEEHQVNGVPLAKLVEEKLEFLNLRSRNLAPSPARAA